jgi:hypothetical protein
VAFGVPAAGATVSVEAPCRISTLGQSTSGSLLGSGPVAGGPNTRAASESLDVLPLEPPVEDPKMPSVLEQPASRPVATKAAPKARNPLPARSWKIFAIPLPLNMCRRGL